MHRFTRIGLAALVSAALLLSGCGGKAATSESVAAHGATAAAGESAAHGEATASAEHSPASSKNTHTQTSAAEGGTTPAASTVSSATPIPSPTPKPTPSPAPKGTVVNGWVVGIPANVPKFACGSLDTDASRIVVQEGRVSTVYSLCFRGVKTTDIDAYAAMLQRQGYDAAAGGIGASYTLTASLDGKQGSVTIVISLTQANGVAMATFGVPG